MAFHNKTSGSRANLAEEELGLIRTLAGILDETGRVMAENQDKVRLNITPREVRERAKLEGILTRAKVPTRGRLEYFDASFPGLALSRSHSGSLRGRVCHHAL